MFALDWGRIVSYIIGFGVGKLIIELVRCFVKVHFGAEKTF